MTAARNIIETDLTYIHTKLGSDIDQMAGKRILITGGAGFLGYYLVQSVMHWNHLLPSSDKISLTVYDNFIRGLPEWLRTASDSEHVEVEKHDITHPLPANTGNLDYIIHAASIASPTYYRKYPIETMDANVNGLRILLDYCKSQKETGHPVRGFLFFSSSEIYGDPDPDHVPTPESYLGRVSCTGPRACYDESKRYGETLCVNFARQYGLPIKTARPFNNYGPGLKITDRRVIPDFSRDILAGNDIVMYSNGRPTRTFCYVADAVVGYFKILVRGRSGEAYNIGTASPEISMIDLALKMTQIAGELWGYKGKVVQRISQESDYLVDNPNRRCPCIDKARSELGFSPEIDLEGGIKKSLLWYAENKLAEDA
jgi:dTDP-glucose 4,6-dehydratase/UDP-glucuronate decarboxylase